SFFVVYGVAPGGITDVEGTFTIGGQKVTGEALTCLGAPANWALAFDPPPCPPARGTLRLWATGVKDPQEYAVDVIHETVAGVVISYPTSSDPVFHDFFMSWGTHDSANQTVTGDLLVDGATPASVSISQVRPTMRWVLSVTDANAGDGVLSVHAAGD